MSFKAPYEGFGTDAIHAGQEPEKWESRSVVPLIGKLIKFKKYPSDYLRLSFKIFKHFYFIFDIRISKFRICIPRKYISVQSFLNLSNNKGFANSFRQRRC